jgi:chromosome partitioning protein
LGTLTINALYAANFILIPCETDRYSLDGFSDLMGTINNVKNGETKDIRQFVRIFLTKFELRNSITNDWVFQELEPYKDLLLNTRIRRTQALNQAHMAQEPIFSFKPDSNGTQDYQQLTNEILKTCQKI